MSLIDILAHERDKARQREADAQHDADEYAERAKRALALRDQARADARDAEKALHTITSIIPKPGGLASSPMGQIIGVLGLGDGGG